MRISAPRLLRLFLLLIAAALVISFPWLPGIELALVTNANLAGEWALVSVSLVILTGWVGQISLAQGTFVGIGAFATGLLARHLGIPFPVNLLIVTIIAAGVAALLGIVALRIRGLYLAVATLIFAWMADAYLFTKAWFVGEGGSSSIEAEVVGRGGTVTAFDLADKRLVYLVILAAVVAALFAMNNLRDSKTGRAFFAIRGSEVAAVSLGIDVTRYKLMAFAVSGALAGIAGNLVMMDLRSASPTSFAFTKSLFFLSIAVVGGITSLGGAVAAALLFAGLEALFFFFEFPQGSLDFLAVALLLIVLLGFPGGLGALSTPIKRLWRRILPVKRIREIHANEHLDSEPAWRSYSSGEYALPVRSERKPILEARGVTVKFGGLLAVSDFSLEVREHEIVGLIGPNGAGKTTCFNAISGLNSPAAGIIKLFGQDVTNKPVHARAQMGVGRTFQLIQLFPQLTVFDNLLVATHMHNSTGLFRHLALTDRAVQIEKQLRNEVREVVGLLGLEEVSDRRVAGLPFGILRQVEIARALVTRAPLLMLDEPASGLDNKETDELSRLLYFLRGEFGLSILLIEHDVQMVTKVSDYMYVIDRGVPLAEGTPDEIQRDPQVIAAYLGESEAPRLIETSRA